MDDKQAKALRAAFPKSAIGVLPKPYKKDSAKGNCQECGGYHGLPAVHLDYVGHAATTDRLLTVDPEWNWRPFTTEEVMSLPPSLRDAGLWIHLTVCGVTRPGVGDGNSAKECIGDAIRNAAMRFGVALDLWAKEDLRGISQARTEMPEPAVAPPVDTGEAMSDKSRAWMFALFGDLKITDKEVQLAGIGMIIGRQIESRSDLSEAEAQVVIKALQEKKALREDRSEP